MVHVATRSPTQLLQPEYRSLISEEKNLFFFLVVVGVAFFCVWGGGVGGGCIEYQRCIDTMRQAQRGNLMLLSYPQVMTCCTSLGISSMLEAENLIPTFI